MGRDAAPGAPAFGKRGEGFCVMALLAPAEQAVGFHEADIGDGESIEPAAIEKEEIGPWTADLFLMACGRLDAFPVGDVGLMESYRLLSESETRLESKAFSERAEAWRPYRGVAAHLLWAWINAEREKAYAADGGG